MTPLEETRFLREHAQKLEAENAAYKQKLNAVKYGLIELLPRYVSANAKQTAERIQKLIKLLQ